MGSPPPVSDPCPSADPKPVFELVNGVARVSVPSGIVDESVPLWRNFVETLLSCTPIQSIASVFELVNGVARVYVPFGIVDESAPLWRNSVAGFLWVTRPMMLKRRYWHIADIPLVVNEWSPEMIQERPNLSAMPLWVDLKGVPGHLFSHIGLRFLTDITGNFVKLHPNTEHYIRLDVARVLVEVDLEKPLTEEICVEGESGSVLLGQSTILGFLLDAMVVLDNIAHPAGSPGSAGESLVVVKSLMTDLDSLKALPVVVSQSETLKIQDSVVQQGEIVEMQSIGVVEVAGKERDSEEGWFVVARRGALATFEMGGVSDHTRFWVQVREPPQRNKRPFQFFNHVALHPQFSEVVAQIWSTTETYGDLPTRVKLAYVDLCQKQNDALTSLHQSSYATVIEAYKKWQHLASIEEQFFCQKSRVQWLHLGDQNTSFFHKVAESRAAKKAIKQLKSSNGEVLTELSAIKAEAVSYKEFLQTQPRDIEIPNVKSIANLVSFRCSAGNAGTLLQPITAEEIRKTVFSMPLNKGPGPDGFTAEFYRASWLIIEADFVVVVQSFFLYGFMSRELMSRIALLVSTLKCQAVNLSHLRFADDIMVFTDGSPQSLRGILAVFDDFACKSGLNINVMKSSLFTAGRGKLQLQREAERVGLAICELPIRYLGLSFTTKALSRTDYEPLIEKIRNKLASWTCRNLSYAGRVQLIKSVIVSITNFWSSVFCLRKRCYREIESMCSTYLWSGSPNDHTKAKVAWEDICVPKNEGGLGIRRLHEVSRVFSLSLIWKILSGSNSLWVAWVNHYLIRPGTFWDVKSTTLRSWQWRKLLKLRPLAASFVSREVASLKQSLNNLRPKPIL
ncbi:hypothetical protein ISN44_As13g005530 [Arabidopsis suecica]|uniref:Reverse transcriptase domain-containing protein n=1 Tax=Arabidopsis suecica TaxID=45249 RepID=A0A8T1XVS4_ARASU|nr:hypothetical protein ISN44_As13g005530 [Arabidopsis suecica]